MKHAWSHNTLHLLLLFHIRLLVPTTNNTKNQRVIKKEVLKQGLKYKKAAHSAAFSIFSLNNLNWSIVG